MKTGGFPRRRWVYGNNTYRENSYNGEERCFLSKPSPFFSPCPLPIPRGTGSPQDNASQNLCRLHPRPSPSRASGNLCPSQSTLHTAKLARSRTGQRPPLTVSMKGTAEPSVGSHVQTPTVQGRSLDLTISKLLINLSEPQFLSVKGCIHLKVVAIITCDPGTQ